LRILVLTPQLPYPPHQGTTMRNYGLIRHLAYRHTVTLLSILAPGDRLDRESPLDGICEMVAGAPQPERTLAQRLWTTLASRLPDMAHRLACPEFKGLLTQVLEEHSFDVVQFEGIEMIPYLDTVLNICGEGSRRPLLVFDDHNAEYVLQYRVYEMDRRIPRRWPGALYSFVQWRKLMRYEARACRSVDVVVAVSGPDADALEHIVPGLSVTILPNGIEMNEYAGFNVDGFLPPNSLVFTGKMDYRPNIDAALWFAQQVLPRVRIRLPDATFYIVGQRPHPRLDVLRSQPGVVITGRVPETTPYIASAAAYVIPLRSGGGTRFKVLEGMAMHKPIISTTMGCDGFPVVSGREVLLVDDADSFADQVVGLLGDPERQRALGEAGYHFAAQYDWSVLVPTLEAAYSAG
jgi:glycosyltransferase involved in cell wall biosynthesis